MTAEPFASDPLPGLRLDGVTLSEAIRLQGEARVHYDDDDLRLDARPVADPHRAWAIPPRAALITLWIVGLIAALAIASYAQVIRQRQGEAAMNVPPPPPEAAPSVPTTPVPPPAAAISPAAPIAAGVQPDVGGSPSTPAAAPTEEAAPLAPAVKTAEADPPKASVAEAKPKPKVKLQAGADADAVLAQEKSLKADAKARPSGDIDHLRQGLNHAYAQAVKAGVPKSVMKAREAEWAVLYPKAKKKSPEAVAALYRARTTQLEALARKHHPATHPGKSAAAA